MSDTNVILEVKNLKKTFDDHEVLKDINTTVKKGEVIAIIGPSGCGKSTFLRSLNLLEVPTSGHIIYEGNDLTEKGVDVAMRHPKEGAPMLASLYSRIPVINAGDGGHSHPTQTMIDLMTIKSRKGRLDKLTVGLCGDLKFGRTVHSLVKSLSRYKGNKYVFISPEELKMPDYMIQDVLNNDSSVYKESRQLEEILPELDVLYMTRVQKERFFSEDEYIRLRDCYILNAEKLKKAPQNMPVLHPLPRITEIAADVDKDPRAAYFEQVQNGVYVRMALIMALLGLTDPVTGKKVI